MSAVPSRPLAPTLSCPHPDVWQALPRRGRGIFRLRSALLFALVTPLLTLAPAFVLSPDALRLVLPVAMLAGLVFGAWLGGRRHGFYRWKLDPAGFAMREGGLWQRQSVVPSTRLQHLDIRRGPLQRRRELATLVLHTAGSHAHTLTLPCLDAGDAEALLALLSARIVSERDDD